MKYLGLAVVSLFWTAAVSAQPIEKHFTVTLRVVPGASPYQLQILSDPQGWDIAMKTRGYVGFQEHERGTITLDLQNVPPNCTGTGPQAWFISKLELSAFGNPTTQKGSGFGVEQDPWLPLDFPDADANGIFAPASKNSSLVVRNMNNFTGAERWIFYRVTVTDCNDQTKTLTSDPVWKNGGK